MTLSADDRVADIVTTSSRLTAPRGRRFLQATSAGRIVSLILLGIVLAFLSVYPLSMLFYGSLHSTPPGVAGVFNLDGYRDIISQKSLLILLNTIGISLAKTIPSLGLAVLLAWILARTDTPFRATLEVLVTLPFFIPPILTAMAWGMLGNPQVGLLNQVYQWLTGSTGSPINVYS
jgi:iron(III) transport system permease protein